jgi:methionine-rich copper-binding protein CopC
VISEAAPQGIIRTDSATLSAVVTDEQSAITAVTIALDGGAAQAVSLANIQGGRVSRPAPNLTSGTHTVTIVATSGGGSTTHTWTFTVELDETPPAITTTAPHGIVRVEKPTISVAASDDLSGVDTIEITVRDSKNANVAGRTTASSDGTSADFVPTSALKAGTYTANAAVTDKSGNPASAKWSFTVEFDTVPPSVTVVSPQAEARVIERKPVISAIYTDSLSGVDETSVKLWLDGTPVVNPKVSATQVSFMPQTELAYGLHTVKLEVSDLATPKVNTATQEWTFRVEDPRVKILDARNFPNPFLDKTTIVFTLTRQAKVTIKIYDMTMRLVRTVVQDEFREAEENVKYPWDGKTDVGEDLARGVYFCQIIIHSELKPESAVLKLALTR